MKLNESMRDTLIAWSQAVDFHNSGNYLGAIELYAKIENLSGRMRYNIACAHFKLGNELDAIENLTMAIERDKHLAVAYFQRGTLYLQRSRTDESISDLEMTRDLLRGNTFIDYKPLGLLVRLSSFQVKHNLALAHIKADRLSDARTLFTEALQDADDLQKKVVYKSLERLDKVSTDLIQSMHVSPYRVFAPPKSVVKNLEKPGIVRRAKVVSASNADDRNAAFEGSKRVRELRKKSVISEKKLNSLQRFIKNLTLRQPSSRAGIKGMKSSKSTSDLRANVRADDNSNHTERRNQTAKIKRSCQKETIGSTEGLSVNQTRLYRSCGDLHKQFSSDVSDAVKSFQLSPFSWMKRLLNNKKQVCTHNKARDEQFPVLVMREGLSTGDQKHPNSLPYTSTSEQGQLQNIRLYRAPTDYENDALTTDRLQVHSDNSERNSMTEPDKTAPININKVADDVSNTEDLTSDNIDTQEVKTNILVTKKRRPPPPSYPPPPLPPTVIIFV